MPLSEPLETVNRFVERHGAPVLVGFLEAIDDILTDHAPDQVRAAIGATPLFGKLGPHAAACMASAIDYRTRNLAFSLKYCFGGKDERDAIDLVFKAARPSWPTPPPRSSAAVTPVSATRKNPR